MSYPILIDSLNAEIQDLRACDCSYKEIERRLINLVKELIKQIKEDLEDNN